MCMSTASLICKSSVIRCYRWALRLRGVDLQRRHISKDIPSCSGSDDWQWEKKKNQTVGVECESLIAWWICQQTLIHLHKKHILYILQILKYTALHYKNENPLLGQRWIELKGLKEKKSLHTELWKQCVIWETKCSLQEEYYVKNVCFFHTDSATICLFQQ